MKQSMQSARSNGPHTAGSGTDAVPEARHSASPQPLVEVSYRAPVNIDA
jgi:hypothetical protein